MQRKITFLSLCVAASILIGAVSFVKAETTLPESGWNYVDVASCEQIGTSIKIKRVATDTYYSTLTSECRDAGYGLQDLGVECISRTRYKASWKPCGSTVLTQEIESLGVYNGATGAQIEGLSNASYVKMNKSYWAKQLVTVPASLDSFKIKLNAVSNLPRGNYSYAFSWVDSSTGSTNFQESLAKTLVNGSNFGSNNYVNFSITDYYRGKWVTVLAFMKNNDGISQVANMPVEVDDVIALHIYIPVKESAPTAPSTPIVPASGYKISAFDLYDQDTNTYLWQSTYSYQSFKGYLGTSVYYIGNSIKNIQYRVNSNVVLGDNSYAIRALTSSDGITQFNENNVQDWAKDLTFVRGSIMNLSVDDKRGKWVTAFAYVRNNDGKSDVPNMPVEVDDVVALNIFVTTMRETTPVTTVPRTVTPTPEPIPTPTSPVVPANNLPACSDIKGGDVTFLVCQGYTIDHYWSGTKVRINEHDSDVAEVDLEGVNEDSATLAKGDSETFNVTNKPGKYITVTYLGLGAGDRALVKISSNTTYEESVVECVDNIGGDGTYTLCPKKKFVHNVSGITLTNKLNNGSYVLLGANGANLKNYKVKYKRSAVITSKINGAKISVTYNTNKRAEGAVITIKTTKPAKKVTPAPKPQSKPVVSEEQNYNYVDVASCEQIGTSIKIKRLADDTNFSTLTSECRDAGHGYRDYVMECASLTRYRVSWKSCNAPISPVKEIPLSSLKLLDYTLLNFENNSGQLDSVYLDKHGVKFTSAKGKGIFISSYNRGGAATASGEFSISNNATYPNTSNNDPFVINLLKGVKAVGFYLGNGNSYGWQVNATINLYNKDDKLIGSFTKGNISDPVTNYFGVSSTELIYKVTIDYGNTTLSEEIDDFMYVPHLFSF